MKLKQSNFERNAKKILGFERFLSQIRDIEKNCLLTKLSWVNFISHRYRIEYKNGLDGLKSGIYDGMDAVRTNMSMPLGQEIHNHTIFVHISVTDNLGAFTTVETKIQVIIEYFLSDA